ncbi:MAG: right-handed parallel beta-helix repeat-containing protein [Bacteroidales bacterium]|nr:right-handed parallel beta-helix repeat-containing protein [Bacteroidales bacterium]
MKGSVILLHNQDYWEISNIEIYGGTNKPNDQVAGIFVEATTAQRVLNHIIIKDCTIRNTLGSIKLYESSAVWVGVPGWDNKNGLTTSFNNVVIENNKIYNSVRNGILVWTCAGPGKESQFQKGLIPSKNVIIRKNHLENIGGDAILVLGSDKPLIEYNTVEHCCTQSGDPKFGKDYNPSSAAIWLHHCENGLMQFNIVINCEKLENNNDGMAYDFDFNCNGNILQYNFSYNNKGGFLLIMPTATNNIARYNVSHNDLSHVLFCVGNKDENNLVYNNTFYNELGKSFIVANSIFYNNIFVALKDAKISVQNPESGIFDSNCYFGNWGTKPKDDNALNEDPLLKPVNAKYGHWHLKKDSPCKQNGKLIPNNGGRDIFGKKISNTKKPSIGACE